MAKDSKSAKRGWAMVMAAVGLALAGCSPDPEGLVAAQPARVTVKMDFFHRPFPEIPLPNDIATRFDASSATLRRVNASMIAPTTYESHTRELLDKLDGWGPLQPITVPFTGPLDVGRILARHRDDDYDLSDDVIYLINVDPDSSELGRIHHLDLGNGNYPVLLERRDIYWKTDPRGQSSSLMYEETDEDRNGNGGLDPGEDETGNGVLDPGEDRDDDGILDPPEDSDADGILDKPNYLPGHHPVADDLAGRADALMTFYERATQTLIARPMMPLRERTTYAVVVTRRLLDAGGQPVGSPFPFINHTSQNEALEPMLELLPAGLDETDIAFAYSFTTQTVQSDWKAVRDGLYGHGVQAHIGAEFPARVESIEPMRDAEAFPGMTKPHLLYSEVWKPFLVQAAKELLGTEEGVFETKLLDGTGYVDYFVVGSYRSPQLFQRTDGSGRPLGYNDQSWPPDLDRVPVDARAETVYFTLAVPRPEVSARGAGQPAPVVIVGHGYTGNRFDVMQFSGYLAQHGLAAVGIDGPSHGLGLSPGEDLLAKALASQFGIAAGAEAILKDRSFDQNGDGSTDSGADFWSAYLFHTRDMVRQFTVDYWQLVRLLRSFDGQRSWSIDVDDDGAAELDGLAGDFDGDGAVDVGMDAPIYAFGASLGGFMSTLLGETEPAVSAIAPVSGGGGYADIGIRSTQGGVYQAFILRSMGPLYVGTIDAESGDMLIETIVPDLNDDFTQTITTLGGVAPWDTVVVQNLQNGVERCGYVSEQGTVRVAVESDVGDRTRILFYRGPQLVAGSTECVRRSGAEPYAVVDSFDEPFIFQSESVDAGSPLRALAEGLGLRRCHPDFRRFSGLGQLVLDPADPAVLARHLLTEPLHYPGTGEQTGAHTLIITTMGDTAVPAASGLTVGRAAGLVDFLVADDRYGKPVNQELIDNYTAEGMNVYERYTNTAGEGIHLDVEVFSGGDDMYGDEVPRLDPPLRLGMDVTDALGGKSAAIFPYNRPEGQHGFDMPGEMIDRVRRQCREQCTETEGDDPCGCNDLVTFDIGNFMMNMVGRYFSSGGQLLSTDRCNSSDDCPEFPAIPAPRDPATLP